MYGRVLLCYDGSAEARRALEEGARLVRVTGAQAHLLALCRKLTHSTIPEGVTESLLDWEMRAGSEVLNEGIRILEELGIRAVGTMTFDDALVRVPAHATDIKADLIVIGYRPRGFLGRWWSSSPKPELLRRAPCAVLIVSGAVCAAREGDSGSRDWPPVEIHPRFVPGSPGGAPDRTPIDTESRHDRH